MFTKEQLYQHVWGDVLVDAGAVMVYISHLRNKLEKDPQKPPVPANGVGARISVRRGGRRTGNMRGMQTSVQDIRRRIFTEVAKMGYEGGDYSRIEELPYKIVHG